MVLATDMSLHFQQIKEMKTAVVKPDTLDRGSTMAFIVHAADISHPTKVWELHKRWTDGLVEEFFRQVRSVMQWYDQCDLRAMPNANLVYHFRHYVIVRLPWSHRVKLDSLTLS